MNRWLSTRYRNQRELGRVAAHATSVRTDELAGRQGRADGEALPVDTGRLMGDRQEWPLSHIGVLRGTVTSLCHGEMQRDCLERSLTSPVDIMD